MTTKQNPASNHIASPETDTGNPDLMAGSNAPPEDAKMEAPTETARLNDEITRLKEEVDRLKDQWVRSVAEIDNIRKRAQREKEETSRYAINAFAGDMVTVLETLKRASESIPASAREENALLKTVGQGVDMTMQELLGIFQRYNINRLDPLNQKFDHNFHQAVAQAERSDVAPGTVVQVIQAGYVIHDRLLRPAMVVVSKSAESPKKVDTTA